MSIAFKTLSVSLLCFVSWHVMAQTTVQVITKKIEKTFTYRKGYEVNVEGERAEVIVESWDKDDIRILLELTARHPDKAIAERDLDAIKYVADRVKNKIYIRNYLSPNEGSATSSTLSARYTIYVPAHCPVYLKNYFGTIDVSNLLSNIKINSEFSKIGLNNLQGLMDIRTRFGDVIGANLDGDMTLNARRSDITLRDIKGNYDLNAQYGIMKIYGSKDLLSLSISAEKTDVYFFNVNPALFAYNLTAQNGEVKLPNNLKYNIIQNNEQIKRIQFKPTSEYFATITISVSFGDIFISK